jgi:ribosome-associated protein
MSRKPKKGYYVQGVFIALGSELDLAYKRELKGTDAASKTDLKRESTERQKLGEDLLELRNDLKQKLLDQGHINTALMDAVSEAKRITNFEGKRRQMQYVGKLMRRLDEAGLQAIRDSLEIQHGGSAKETLALHESEAWRKRLIEDDQALGEWLSKYPRQEPQQFRALVRQARKDAQPLTRAEVSTGKAPRQGRAYRELFRWIRETLHPTRVDGDQHRDDAIFFDPHDLQHDETDDSLKPVQVQPIFLSVEEIKYKEELAREELKALQAEKERFKEKAPIKKIAPHKSVTMAKNTDTQTESRTAAKTAATISAKETATQTKAKKPVTKPATKPATKTAVKSPAKSALQSVAKNKAKKTATKKTAAKTVAQPIRKASDKSSSKKTPTPSLATSTPKASKKP